MGIKDGHLVLIFPSHRHNVHHFTCGLTDHICLTFVRPTLHIIMKSVFLFLAMAFATLLHASPVLTEDITKRCEGEYVSCLFRRRDRI